MASDAGELFLKISADRLSRAFERIHHTVRQLTDDQIWRRPAPSSNSIGIILQHLTGNLSQWVLAGLGGREFKRNRPAEFSTESRLPKDELLRAFSRLGDDVQAVVRSIPAGTLADPKRIQGYDETVLSALYNAATHIELHGGQIQYAAKTMLGDAYKDFWTPATPEQRSGA